MTNSSQDINNADANTVKKTTLQKFIVPVLAITILLLMVAWLAGSFNEKVAPSIHNKSHDVKFDKRKRFTLIASQKEIFEPVAASVEAKQATMISSRILARIDKIDIRAGDIIKKGDVLIQLEQQDLQSQVIQAKQNINAMKARHKEEIGRASCRERV